MMHNQQDNLNRPAIAGQQHGQSLIVSRQGHDTGRRDLFDREPPPEYLQEWTERIAAEKYELEPGTRSVVIFRIGVEWLALSTHVIQEVTESSAIHSIPHHRNGVVIGLVSIRGNLVVCASLGVVLGLKTNQRASRDNMKSTGERLLIINQKTGPLAFPVDEVSGVQRYHPRELKAVPATLANAAARYTTGLLPWQEKAVGCLDEELLLYTLSKGLL